MIRNNKRKPGTISITPSQNCRRSNVHIENYLPNQEDNNQSHPFIQTAPILKVNHMNTRDTEDTSKKRQKTSYFDSIEMCQMGIENIQDHLDKKINLDTISVVKLSENSLQSFPSTVFNKLNNLTELHLNRNYLQKISFPYFKENKIKIIDISCNQLTSLNMEHLDKMQTLNCSQNNLTFLTLPQSIVYLNSSSNKLSNIYFMDNCSQLRQVNLCNNFLYDLKFNFRASEGRQRQGEIRYKMLECLDCSNNKIQYFEGLVHIINVKVLLLNNNVLSLTRNLINELFTLQNLEELSIHHNPLQDGGFRVEEIMQMICSKIPSLYLLNEENTDHYQDPQPSYYSSSKKSHFSDIADEPYQLFMPSQRKQKQQDKNVLQQIDWNFTLGDCDNEEPKEEEEINDLSLIQELKNVEGNHQLLVKNCDPIFQEMNQNQLNKDAPQISHKEIKLKIVRSTCPLSAPHHIHYQPFLKDLLPMSYVPPRPLFRETSKVSSRRLQEDDDDYLLISQMFSSRGGVAYIKKVMVWTVWQNEQQIFGRYYVRSRQSYLGFLLNEISEKEFKQMAKLNRLMPRKSKDVIGMQPNVFSFFHIIVRFNSFSEDQYYPCAYLIESCQI